MIGSQKLGRWAQITPDTGLPLGNEANRLTLYSTWNRNLLPTCWILSVYLQNASPPAAVDVDLYLWGRDYENNVWGRLGLNDGHVNGGTEYTSATLWDSWYYVLQNLEIWKDLYLQQVNTTGSPTLTCYLAPLYEQAIELRGL